MRDPTPYLHVLASTDYEWRALNCGTAIGRFVKWSRRMNRDPAEEWYGLGDTRSEYHAALRKVSRLQKLFDREARELGLRKVAPSECAAGCVAVVRYPVAGPHKSHHGAIKTRSGRWALKVSEGLLFLPESELRIIAAWDPNVEQL